MRYGISVPNVGDAGTLVELGVEADRFGWDGFFLWDHMRLLRAVSVPVFDPWVVLGALAARTERIRIGTMVTPVARRRPWKLARETVTLDHLSGGRVILGVGLGFPPDADFELLGEDPDPRVRAGKLDEGLELLARFWGGELFDFEGRHFHVRETQFQPAPVRGSRIPVWVAGMWPNRRPFRRAARWDGVFPVKVTEQGMPADITPDGLREVLTFVDEHRAHDRAFDVAASGFGIDDDLVRAYEAAGATWYFPRAAEGPGWEEPTHELIRHPPSR